MFILQETLEESRKLPNALLAERSTPSPNVRVAPTFRHKQVSVYFIICLLTSLCMHIMKSVNNTVYMYLLSQTQTI